MRLVVLEGPDASGKTTLAGELARLGYIVKKNAVPSAGMKPGDLAAAYVNQLNEAAATGMDVAVDRSWVSETIYGPEMRGRSLVTLPECVELEGLVHRLGGALVLCLPPWERVADVWVSRRDSEYVKDWHALKRIYAGYEDYACRHNALRLGMMRWDYTHVDAPSFARALKAMEAPR